MGKKSRLKREKKLQGFERELKRHPTEETIRAFLRERGINVDRASGFLYVVSLCTSFLIQRSIRQNLQLPVISPEEDKADENRLNGLSGLLTFECEQLRIKPDEVMNQLIVPMVGNRALIEPILKKVYEMFDALIPSDSFREPTEAQIDNPELWGDSLAHYKDRKEQYFLAVRDLVALVLAIARSTVEGEPKKIDHKARIDEIRKTYSIEPDDFEKLRRRAREFYKIAFAKFLSMVFQPVREEVDKKIFKVE